MRLLQNGSIEETSTISYVKPMYKSTIKNNKIMRLYTKAFAQQDTQYEQPWQISYQAHGQTQPIWTKIVVDQYG